MSRVKGRDPGRSEGVAEFQRRLCRWTLSAAVAVGLVFLAAGEKAVAKGLVLGACFSILNFLLLGAALPWTLGRSSMKARAIGLLSIFGRYAVLAVPLILGVKMAAFNFVAVVIGLFAVQIMTLIDQWRPNRRQG